jgi:tRNA wybutosine-synthesizing protein 1
LIEGFQKKGFTTFLVSNGTVSLALANLSKESTQLYFSVCSLDEEAYKHVCRPQIPNAREKLNETLTLLPTFKCPTVIWITSASGLNMSKVEGYAKLTEKAKPTYMEAKAYMHVGFSRLRLGYESMPSHDEIRDFSMQLANETGYNLIDESIESRIVLLSNLQNPMRFGGGWD